MESIIHDPIIPPQNIPEYVESIEEELEDHDVLSEEERDHLYEELSLASRSVEIMREKATAVDQWAKKNIPLVNIKEIQEKIITLWGRVQTRWVESEVIHIKDAAEEICDELAKPDWEKLSKKVDWLKCHISTLMTHNRLLRKELKIITFAKEAVKAAENVLQHKGFDALKLLRLQHPEDQYIDPEDEEMALELYEIAGLFEQNNPTAEIRFRQLPESIRARLKNRNNPQALITLAHELTDTPDEDIGDMLRDLKQIGPQTGKSISLHILQPA